MSGQGRRLRRGVRGPVPTSGPVEPAVVTGDPTRPSDRPRPGARPIQRVGKGWWGWGGPPGSGPEWVGKSPGRGGGNWGVRLEAEDERSKEGSLDWSGNYDGGLGLGRECGLGTGSG